MTEKETREMLNNKTKKLMNSKSFNNRILIIRFIVMGSLFTVYFGFIFYFQTLFLWRVNYALASAESLWKCPIALKGTSLYTFESLVRQEECKTYL